ncbi:MAG: proteasome subunit alpha, partial [Thermoplasmata archaeon]
KATAEGEGRDAAIEYFEKNYEESMNMNEAIMLGLNALKISTEKELSLEAIEIGVVTEGEEFKILSQKETKKYFDKIKEE